MWYLYYYSSRFFVHKYRAHTRRDEPYKRELVVDIYHNYVVGRRVLDVVDGDL